MAEPWSNPARFNMRFYKCSICRYWRVGACLRGRDCVYAHGAAELRQPNSDDTPPHVKRVRQQQDEAYDQLRREGWRGTPNGKGRRRRIRLQEASPRSAKRGRAAKDSRSPSRSPCQSMASSYVSESSSGPAAPAAKTPAAAAAAQAPPAAAAVAAAPPAVPAAAEAAAAVGVRADPLLPVKAAADEAPATVGARAAPPPPAKAAAEEPAAVGLRAAPPPLAKAKAAAEEPAAGSVRAAPPLPAEAAAEQPAAGLQPPSEASRSASRSATPRPVKVKRVKATAIHVRGFSRPVTLWLGDKAAARSTEWMDTAKVLSLVRCCPHGRGEEEEEEQRLSIKRELARCGRHGHGRGEERLSSRKEVVVGLGWGDVQDLQQHFAKVNALFGLLSSRPGSILFWGRRGRHRHHAAAVLSMFILHSYPAEPADAVMHTLSQLRNDVQFGELGGGRYPPLAKLVRAWRDWLLTGRVSEEFQAELHAGVC